MRNLAIYGIVAAGFVGYNMMTQADRDSTGAIVSGGDVDAFTMRVGDCFDDTSSIATQDGGEVTSLPGVPCSEPHDNEVYAVIDLDVASFPQGDEMSELAFESCLGRFESFVGLEYESSTLDILTLYPTEDSWKLQNDREVVCALYDMSEQKLTGSAKGSGV